MKNNPKIKDIMLIALLTAVYSLLYTLSMVVITPLGSFGHAISPGISALFTGTVIYFMARKVGKMWQYSIMTIIVMGLAAIMGGGYIPWVITSMLGAVIADFMVSKSKKTPVLTIAIASGIMHVGQAWGSILPSWLFLNAYREEWIQRGQTAAAMEEQIKYTAGVWGLYSTIIVFVLAFIGVYIGYYILRKHFKEA